MGDLLASFRITFVSHLHISLKIWLFIKPSALIGRKDLLFLKETEACQRINGHIFEGAISVDTCCNTGIN